MQTSRSRTSPCPASSLTAAMSEVQRSHSWGPADHGTVTPLMGLAAAGTIAPLMGLAAPATVTPLMGLADRGTMVSLMGLADLGTAKPLMVPSRNASRGPQDGRIVRPGRPGWEQIAIPGDRG